MKNTQIDLSGFSLEEILDAIKKICEDHDDEDGSLYLKRWASSDCGNTDLNFYIKNQISIQIKKKFLIYFPLF